ncbi:nucleotidyltransferase family protein [Marinobacter subterrani]|uniref:CTP:molybdopterin cytidylyltransferase MocA n=1 Tax=Marinobacter subterrani TaxID=1658765 RepID=A0A0J7J9J5_9GAMM|nr:nucleotidyltransferase family protein [Marinobacter subterrani]KMQ74872.1 CTP:molybdopterin cytidylyltransferase MocA [Marinobacter subterrani]
MIDGRILAKIPGYSSLAECRAPLLPAIGRIIINFRRQINDQEFPALILAAGASSRLGRPKALLPLGAGKRVVLDQAIEQGRVLSRDVRVVCGAWYPLIRFRCQRQPSVWLKAPEWHEGLSASLAAGIRSLGPAVKGVFVLVADQPLLDLNALKAFGDAARYVPEQPIAADYGNRPGVPAYLPRWLWPLVLDLEGDRGAGRLLAEVRATRVEIPGVHDDVDTPADWQRIRALLSQTGPTTRRSRR